MSKDTNVSLVVEASDGRPMRCYSHEGKTYVEAPDTRVYQLRVKNKTGKRIKVVIAVDSLNIISGGAATNDPVETGYLLNPYEEQIFKGFRVDDDTVAQFTFVKREQSYATERGEGAGNGVIAIRAYAEKEKKQELSDYWKELYEKERNKPREKEYIPYHPWHPYWERPYYHYYEPKWWSTCGGAIGYGGDNLSVTAGAGGTAHNVGCAASSVVSCVTTQNMGVETMACVSNAGTQIGAASLKSADRIEENPFSMGSGWGETVKDSVKSVEFEVGVLLVEESIYYTTLEGLKALGVNVERVKQVVFPQAFKASYCPRPTGWKG